MSIRHTLQSIVFACALIAFLPSARAAVCVDVDAERDSFSTLQQQATRTLVEDRLRQEGKTIGSEDCEATYTVYNLKFGDTIVANLAGPQGQRKLEADSVEELPETYDQLVSSLVAGKKVGETTDRKNVTDGQSNDTRLDADTVIYLSTGYGGTFGGEYAAGPSIAFGWRHEIQHFALDFSVADVTIPTNRESSYGNRPSGSWFQIGAMYLFDQYSAHTPYVGAGVGFGVTHVKEDDPDSEFGHSFRGRGVNIDLSGGWEFFRTSNVRFFVQGDVVLPTYKSQPTQSKIRGDDGNVVRTFEPRYTPGFELSLGGGFSF
jgi:hypothetical protein